MMIIKRPARTVLFPPKALPYAIRRRESFTSFCSRMAIDRGTRVRSMLEFIGDSIGISASSLFFRPSALNGGGEIAMQIVAGAEKLSGRRGFRFMTLSPLKALFPERGLLKPDLYWCRSCYDEWRSAKAIIYQPLSWSVNESVVCSRHGEKLMSRCPNPKCNSVPSYFVETPGRCEKCGQWLGHASPRNEEEFDEHERERRLWHAQQIAVLVALSHRLHLSARDMPRIIRNFVNLMLCFDLDFAAGILSLPKKDFRDWISGASTPRLGQVLDMCYTFRIPVMQFLHSTFIPDRKHSMDFPRPRKPRPQWKGVTKQETPLLALIGFLAHDPPLSLRSVAERLGVWYDGLRSEYQVISGMITDRYHDGVARTRDIKCQAIRDAVVSLINEKYPTSTLVAETVLERTGLQVNLRDPVLHTFWLETLAELGVVDCFPVGNADSSHGPLDGRDHTDLSGSRMDLTRVSRGEEE